MTRGLRSNIAFPFEDDTAIMELWIGDQEWAELELEGVDLDASGEKRLATAHVVVHLCLPRRAGEHLSWRFGFDEAQAQLEQAARRRWWWGFGVTEAMAELQSARDRLLAHERHQ